MPGDGFQQKQFAARTLGEVQIETKVVEALPVDGILQVARDISADLIAMGTHGRSGFNRLMLGSLAERILRASEVPVLTVPPRAAGLTGSPEFKRILVPVNNSAAAHSIIAAASDQSCDLLVLGARRQRFFDSTIFGTTSVRVVRHAPCPVLTVVSKE